MNLMDERNYQMRQDVLDCMNLSPENRKMAEEYLDTDQPENRELLKAAAPQDFSKLTEDSGKKCGSYMDHLIKRSRVEELGRYCRLCAAIGGSTAKYTLFNYGWGWSNGAVMRGGTNLREYFTDEQYVAMRAEMLAWTGYLLNNRAAKDLIETAQKDPDVLYRAMKLCYHSSDNAKTLLAGIYLNHVKPAEAQKGFLKGLFGRGEKKENGNVEETVKFLENTLVGSIQNMFDSTQKLTDWDLSALKNFLSGSPADASFPNYVDGILSSRKAGEYLTRLLAGAAFLAIEHSEKFHLFVRFCMKVNLEVTLNTCSQMSSIEWFNKHLELLERNLTVSAADYCRVCVKSNFAGPVRRMAGSDESAIRGIMASLSTDEYQFLMNQVSKGNPALYRELNSHYEDEFRFRLADEITEKYQSGKSEARAYLLGQTAADQLYPFVNEWRQNPWRYYNHNVHAKISQLRDGKDPAMFRRAIVLEGLGQRGHYICQNRLYHGTANYDYKNVIDKKQVETLIDMFEAEGVSISCCLEMMDGLYNYYYQDSQKNKAMNACVEALAKKEPEWSAQLQELGKNGSAIVRYLCVRVLDAYGWQKYKDFLLSCAVDTSKQVRELLAAVYGSHKEWEPEVVSMLSSKKSQEREMALLVIKQWGVGSYQEELKKAAEAEKSKKLKDQMLTMLGVETGSNEKGQPAQVAQQTVDQLAADILKGGKKRKVAWVYETPCPAVHKADGSEADGDFVSAILVAYADMGIPGVSKDAAKLAAELDQKELAAFVNALFSKWLDSGAEAKKKWVLYAASIHGGDQIVPVLHHQIQVWPEAARGAIAAEAVKALALNGTSTALLLVDQIARKFKNRQVKTAAGEALTYAAEQLGITRMELEDRIVPNLDFDDKMERHFDYGTRSFRVKLTAALELEIFDETGKKIKNLPAPGKRDDEEKAKAASDAFKLMKKQLKTVVTNQKQRLESALSAERLWTADKWNELFVRNPIMHQFAMGLIWGVYEQGKLTDTFRYMEDGSFNTVDEDEYELSTDAMVGLVHPIELTQEQLDAWKEQLSDYEVTQPFEQLERPVYRITEEEQGEGVKELTRFGGMVLNGLSLSGKLLGQGWYRGEIMDAGFFDHYYRDDGANGVRLEFSGYSVGYEVDEVTVYGVYFFPSGNLAKTGYSYGKDKDKDASFLSDVSPRYFSEIILLVTRATASSQDRLAYPACRN